jgi:hypothetical protein
MFNAKLGIGISYHGTLETSKMALIAGGCWRLLSNLSLF